MPEWLAWTINLPLLVLALWAFWRAVGRPNLLRSGFGVVLAGRLVGSVALGIFYIDKFTDGEQSGGDTFTMHRYSARLTAWAYQDFDAYLHHIRTGIESAHSPEMLYSAFSNSYFLVRILSLLNFLTASNYWIDALWLSVAAFMGAWLLARELGRLLPAARGGILVGLLWPSVIFWTTGLSKDAALLACLGTFVAAVLRLTYPVRTAELRRSWGLLVPLLIISWLLWKIKFFIAAVAFVSFGALALAERLQGRWPRIRPWQLFLGLALLLAPLSRVFHRAFRPDYLRTQLPINQAYLSAHSVGQPQLVLPLEPSLWSFLQYAPLAAVGVFTRPWVWEGSGLLWRVTGLENAVILGLFAWAVVGWWRRGRPWGLPLLAGAVLLFVVVVAVMFGLSTPNLGTLHRYRAGLLPFVFFLLDWLRVGAGAQPVIFPLDNLRRSSRLSGYAPDSAGGAG